MIEIQVQRNAGRKVVEQMQAGEMASSVRLKCSRLRTDFHAAGARLVGGVGPGAGLASGRDGVGVAHQFIELGDIGVVFALDDIAPTVGANVRAVADGVPLLQEPLVREPAAVSLDKTAAMPE
jgi:hypothetical protein